MAAVETGESKSASRRAGKKHRRKRKVGVRIDMTPMVDVVMLLLTFFMLTTYFSKPQAMEINVPPDDKNTVEVAESNLLTIRVAQDNTIYWNMAREPAKLVEFNDLHALLLERIKSNPKLITLVRIDRQSTYKMMVDILDELNLANITRFSLAPMQQYDEREIQKARAS
jgi:biopolymer transport protein ExbD